MTSDHATLIRCVLCGRIKAVRQLGNGNMWCDHCRIEFDAVDDGTIGYGPPDRRINRQERQRRPNR